MVMGVSAGSAGYAAYADTYALAGTSRTAQGRGVAQSARSSGGSGQTAAPGDSGDAAAQSAGGATGGATGSSGGSGGIPGKAALTPEQEKQVQKLKDTDAKVRAHEQAHLAASGGLASSGATFSYTTGPDGRRYAVAGEVKISMAAGRTPQETESRARQIRAAALAPADPSPQDRTVAARAAQMEAEASQDAAKQGLGQGSGGTSAGSAAGEVGRASAKGQAGAAQSAKAFAKASPVSNDTSGNSPSLSAGGEGAVGNLVPASGGFSQLSNANSPVAFYQSVSVAGQSHAQSASRLSLVA